MSDDVTRMAADDVRKAAGLLDREARYRRERPDDFATGITAAMETVSRHILATRPTPAADDAMVTGLRERAAYYNQCATEHTTAPWLQEQAKANAELAALLTAAADRLAGPGVEGAGQMPAIKKMANTIDRLRERVAALEAAARPVKHWIDFGLGDEDDDVYCATTTNADGGPRADEESPTVGQLRTLAALLPPAPTEDVT